MTDGHATGAEWRPDPRGEAALRWWDGEEFTEHVHGELAGPPAPRREPNSGIADRTRLHKKANAALDANLGPDEEVRVVITGPSAQAIIGTDRRVFVYKKGFMAGATFGAEITSWDYRNINGIQIHTGMMSGAVVVQAPGQSGASTSYWKNSDTDPYKVPNAIPIVRPWEQAETGVAELRRLVADAHSPPERAQPSVSVGDLATELQKLAALHAQGALDADEFKSAKAALIAKHT